jgi:hypothetical protein
MIDQGMDSQGYAEHRRTGRMVAAWLAVLTAAEYIVAVSLESPLIWLIPFVLVKGWLILRYFMHIRDVTREEY